MSSGEKTHVLSLAEGATASVTGRFAGRLLAVIGDILVARVLGPVSFGVYSIGWTIFRFMEVIIPLGLDMGVIRFGALYWRRDQPAFRIIFFSAVTGTLIFSSLAAILFYIGAPWLAASVFGKPDLALVIRFFAFGFPLTGILAVLTAATRLTHDMKYTVILQDLGQPLLAFALLVLFLLAGSRLIGILLSDILSYGALALLAIFYVRKLFPGILDRSLPFPFKVPLGLFTYSLASSLTAVLNILVFWVDRLLIGYFLPSSSAGIYQAVSQISVIFVVVLSGINRIVIPILADLHQAGRIAEMQDIYRVSTKWGVYLCLPVLVVLSFSPREVLLVTYGQEYVSGAAIILALLFGQTINLLTGPVGPLLVAAGHQNYALVLSTIALVINIALNILLLPVLGIMGAAIATSVSLSVLYVTALLGTRKKLGLWPYDFKYLKGLAALCVSMLPALLLRNWSSTSPFLHLVLQFAVIQITFLFVLYITRFDEEDHMLLDALRKRLKFGPGAL